MYPFLVTYRAAAAAVVQTATECSEALGGLLNRRFPALPAIKIKQQAIKLTALVTHRGIDSLLPGQNPDWLSLPLKLILLKTVHRTVFLT